MATNRIEMSTDKIVRLMEKIDSDLLDYRSHIDTLAAAYMGKKSAVEQKCNEMRGQWKDSYIQQYRVEQEKQSIEEASKKMRLLREKASPLVQLSLNKLNNEIDKMFDAPIDPDFASKINAIVVSGLTLTDTEFALLKKQAKGFTEMRLLKQIAESRTKQALGVELKDGKPETISVEVSDIYNIGQLPDIESVYKAFKNFESAVKFVLSSYSGQEAELSEALEGDKSATLAIAARGYFKHTSYNILSQEIEKAATILPSMKPRESITDAEKALIDIAIDPKDCERFPTLIPERVRKTAARSDILADCLSRDERYSQYLES